MSTDKATKVCRIQTSMAPSVLSQDLLVSKIKEEFELKQGSQREGPSNAGAVFQLNT